MKILSLSALLAASLSVAAPRPLTLAEAAFGVYADPASLDDHAWGDWLFLENNEAGVVREWWCHVPTSFWFIAERNTVTDEILKTYPAGELFKDRVNFAPKAEKK